MAQLGDVGPLDPLRRAEVVRRAIAAFSAAVPGSEVNVRGSLAGGTADPWSDIDLRWTVPDDQFSAAIAACASAAEATAGPVALHRLDPDLAHSTGRRVVFVLFEQFPLFWRLDIDIRAASCADVEGYDEDNPAARSSHWSRPASALMNAIAAVRAIRRGDAGQADGLLERGFQRIGAAAPHGTTTAGHRAERLAVACSEADPSLAPIAGRVRVLAADLQVPD